MKKSYSERIAKAERKYKAGETVTDSVLTRLAAGITKFAASPYTLGIAAGVVIGSAVMWLVMWLW